MKIELDQNEKEQLIRDVMENFPEASEAGGVPCIDWDYEKTEFVFVDSEGEKPQEVTVNMESLLKGLDKMWADIGVKYFNGNPDITQETMTDPCNWDANDANALVEYTLYGEVIYG